MNTGQPRDTLKLCTWGEFKSRITCQGEVGLGLVNSELEDVLNHPDITSYKIDLFSNKHRFPHNIMKHK